MEAQDSLVVYGMKRVIITITAVVCALLQIVDMTIVNIALPDMQGSMGASLSEITWVITAYAISNVIVMPMTSWLSQQFGRRNYFSASIILFTVCSWLCGNASGITELIIFRFLQGIGGGALLVTAQTIITESYPIEKRATAQTIYVLGVIVGPTLGPPLGGYIVDNFSWPFIFYINIPIGIIATILTLQFVKSPKYADKRKSRDVDWLGIMLLILSVGFLQFILEKGQEEDWFNSTLITTSAVISFFAFYFFIWRETVYKYPIVNLRVLRNKELSIGSILSFVLGFGLYGSTFIIPLYTQTIMGWTAFQAGMLMIPSTVFTAIMMPFVGKLMEKGFPFGIMISTGMVIFFIYSVMAYKVLTPDTGSDAFFWILVIRGIGLGLLSIPVTTLALSTLKGVQIGEGAAISGMLRQLGGSFGVAIISTYITREIAAYRNDLASNLTAASQFTQQRLSLLSHGFQAKGMTPDVARNSALKLMDQILTGQATIRSYMDVFFWIGMMFLVCVPFVLVLVRNSKTKVDISAMMHE
ncbi:MDR family MFS transporter [Arachidicoccus ginsenosidivorans]|jgi:DHA2 family multidrug resistance protein|uniref:DHA2 family efflux MFS transporter permease subunit n=1 Tax=Arachidicoccus ginsenosidivorans TaxID=496057 RepID=A0A5B8VPQ3_9BACT|nr:DHA2 family efflux MFS transporter permease subunit [Arachidicoccus ginsenosidivorans]QEC72656.1 DHA2 family efflux MFS transporter permease subunit [Arachidicoccus ginsenosidivorans]